MKANYKVILLSLLQSLLCIFLAAGQKQANYWYFADNMGLHFVNGEPELLDDGAISDDFCLEGSSAISDSSGQLLFYCCAEKIFNRLHQVMPNGDNLLGGGSSTQGAMIVPMPGSDERFYVFTLDEFQNNLANGLNYYIVNMCLEDGLGDVEVTPNFAGGGSTGTLLLADAGEKQAATYHANGDDIWLVTRRHFSNEFYAFLLTQEGIEEPVISAIGWDNSNPNPDDSDYANAIGQMKLSPDGSKLAMAIGNNPIGRLELFDFNNSNGIISNDRSLFSENNGFPYGIAFSQDSHVLYFRGIGPTGIRQYNITLPLTSQMIASGFDLPWDGGFGGTGLQLANNGKIYISFGSYLGVIHEPNVLGEACNYEGQAIEVYNGIGTFSVYTLPGFIDGFNYHNGIPECFPDNVRELAQNQFLVLSPMPCNDMLLVASSHANLRFTSLQLISAAGQVMTHLDALPYTLSRYELDVNTVPEGIYYLEVSSGVGKIYRKVIVDR